MFGIRNSTFSLINAKTGEVLIPPTPIPEPIIESQMSVDINPSFSMTMENCQIPPEVMSILFGNKEPIHKYNIEAKGTRPVMIQARKHRAKRINKKWLKRYGYKEIQVPVSMRLERCTLTPNECGNNCYTIEGQIDEIK